jgi:hypothetical protein
MDSPRHSDARASVNAGVLPESDLCAAQFLLTGLHDQQRTTQKKSNALKTGHRLRLVVCHTKARLPVLWSKWRKKSRLIG